MAKIIPSVLGFISSGKTSGVNTTIVAEGWSFRADLGEGLSFIKTTDIDTASQNPIELDDHKISDSEGYLYTLSSGSCLYYNGSNNWFPAPFGSSGIGFYTYTGSTWVYEPSKQYVDNQSIQDRNRSNHTGTQIAATISDFATAAQQQVTYESLAINGDIGKASSTVAAGDDSRFLSDTQKSSLISSSDSTLHYHSSDRDRSNHTGTQIAATISDFATAAQQNVTYEALDSNSDIGQISGTVASGGDTRFLTSEQKSSLISSSDSTLHYHSSDRNRSNHTGTQLAATISDFDTAVSNNTKVTANTNARHSAVTVTDSTEIDFTLVGQNITAALKTGSIAKTKLDSSVQTSLSKADSALQSESDTLATVVGRGSTTAAEITVGGITVTDPTSGFTDAVNTVIGEYNSVPVVDLPLQSGNVINALNGPLSFTCSAVRYGINASGILQKYEADEIMFNSEGAILGHREIVTINVNTDDLTSTTFAKSGLTISSDMITSPLPSDYADKIVESSSAVAHRIGRSSIPSITGFSYACTFFAKAAERSRGFVYYYNGFGVSKICEFDLVAKTFTNGKITPMADGWFMLQSYHTATQDGYSGIHIYLRDDTQTEAYQGDGASGMYIYGFTLAQFNGYSPYIKANGTVTSIPAAITSIPIMNNLPLPGAPFTIELDIVLSTSCVNYEKLVYIGDTANSLYFAYDAAGAIYIGIVTDVTTYTTGKLPAYDGLSRMFVVYDGDTITIINNTTGDSRSSSVSGTPTYLDSESIYLCVNGRTTSQFTSEPISNFKIYHKALSAEEIASKGGA